VSAARDETLARVGAAIAGAPAPDSVPHAYRRRGTLTAAERLDLLAERLVDYRAQVRRVAPHDLPRAIVEAAPGRNGIPAGLPPAWRPADVVEDGGLTPPELDALDGVVTACTLAIAETGTLVLAGGPSEGRRALTLVPDRHVCIVHAEQVVETVPEAFDALRGLERRPLTFVSGPSATSDIELERVEGVHGPRTLVVLIVESPPEAHTSIATAAPRSSSPS
jgi:L-lactate dehydrogenase complex protein LldG